jgi:hypothetical protein
VGAMFKGSTREWWGHGDLASSLGASDHNFAEAGLRGCWRTARSLFGSCSAAFGDSADLSHDHLGGSGTFPSPWQIQTMVRSLRKSSHRRFRGTENTLSSVSVRDEPCPAFVQSDALVSLQNSLLSLAHIRPVNNNSFFYQFSIHGVPLGCSLEVLQVSSRC